MPKLLLALDQGTTSTRAILFDADARPLTSHAIRNCGRSIPPMAGSSMIAEEIWQATLACCRAVAEGRAGE